MGKTELIEKGVALFKAGEKSSAFQHFEQVLNIEPLNAIAIHFSGLIAAENNQADVAIHLLVKSIELEPKNAQYRFNTGVIYLQLGNKNEAIKKFEETIKLKPDYVAAYNAIAANDKLESDSETFRLLLKQLKKKKNTDLQLTGLHFAAANIFANEKNYDRAFYHYSQGNKHKKVTSNHQAQLASNKQQKAIFNTSLISNREGWGSSSQKPIFILGMPRSGSTLVEQILSSHSKVFGAGEIKTLPLIAKHINQNFGSYPDCLQSINQEAINLYAEKYLSEISEKSSSEFVVNKYPYNFNHIGLIFLLFPNAKVIHTVRNPIDTCLSCFFQNFVEGNFYTFNLDSLGKYYNAYVDLMRHWKALYGNRLYDVEYESLVNSPKAEISRLLEYCNLDWEDACLDFSKTERLVKTASISQVRQAISTSSVERWRPYKKHLLPLFKVLDPKIIDQIDT